MRKEIGKDSGGRKEIAKTGGRKAISKDRVEERKLAKTGGRSLTVSYGMILLKGNRQRQR